MRAHYAEKLAPKVHFQKKNCPRKYVTFYPAKDRNALTNTMISLPSQAPLLSIYKKGSRWDLNGSRKHTISGIITPQRLSSKRNHRRPKHRSSFGLSISEAWKARPPFLPLPKEVRRKTLMWKAWLNFKEERMHSLDGWIFFEREKRSSCRRFMPTKEEGHFCY